MAKFEVVTKDGGGRFFDTLADAKVIGIQLIRQGASVHIEVYPETPGPMSAFRYDKEVNDWVSTPLPLSP